MTDQQGSEVAARRQTRPADVVGIESSAEFVDVPVEVTLVRNLIQSA
jgi:hypothetical protein